MIGADCFGEVEWERCFTAAFCLSLFARSLSPFLCSGFGSSSLGISSLVVSLARRRRFLSVSSTRKSMDN